MAQVILVSQYSQPGVIPKQKRKKFPDLIKILKGNINYNNYFK